MDPADFIFNKDDPVESAIEGDIVSDLKNVGITVKSRALTKDDLNSNMTAGNFHLAFTESQGPPYDPQAFANSWGKPDEAYHAALEGLQAPNDKATIIQSIKDVQLIVDETKREEKWTDILSALHRQATELPISGKRIPAVFNKRLTGYVPGLQQYDYPAHTIQVLGGSRGRTVTVAPGGQGGLFSSVTGVGRLDAHTYRPNEFWANNWVYEGLVEYGPGGTILPSLAESWTISEDKQTYTFTLRQNVEFHDGAVWNCAAAKLNFDHVLALTHPWYGMPGQIDEWSCTGETFVVTTKAKYYPLLQELTFIRPLRMQSPNRFASGATTNEISENSCVSGNVFGDDDDYADKVVTCAGIKGGGVSNGGNVSGTGRWIYTKTVKTGDSIDQVHFARNENHWDPPTGNTFVKELIVVHYATHEAVKAALLDGTLDAVMGSGPLKVTDIADLKKNKPDPIGSVLLTEPIQNRIVVMNTAKGPTKDLQTRKAIIHAVNKPSIIKNDLAGLESPAEALFPKDAPYCGADLTPRPEYDFEKARLLNCPAPEEKNQLQAPIIAIIVVLAFAAVAFGTVLVVMYRREKTGEPIFQPLVKPQETGKDMDIA